MTLRNSTRVGARTAELSSKSRAHALLLAPGKELRYQRLQVNIRWGSKNCSTLRSKYAAARETATSRLFCFCFFVVCFSCLFVSIFRFPFFLFFSPVDTSWVNGQLSSWCGPAASPFSPSQLPLSTYLLQCYPSMHMASLMKTPLWSLRQV